MITSRSTSSYYWVATHSVSHTLCFRVGQTATGNITPGTSMLQATRGHSLKETYCICEKLLLLHTIKTLVF